MTKFEKHRLNVLIDNADPERHALAHFDYLKGVTCVGTMRVAQGMLVKLAHDSFPLVKEGEDYVVPVVDIKDN